MMTTINNKKSLNKTLKSILFGLAAIITTGAIVILPTLYMATDGQRDTFTICSDDEYYSETTYYYNEKDFNNHIKSQTNEATTTPATMRSNLTSGDTQSDDKFVVGVSKSVWVEEKYDENGNTTDSRLLKKAEIDSPDNYNNNTLATAATVNNDKFYGPVTTAKHRLTIKLTVFYDDSDSQYDITATASWKAELVWGWENDKAAEEDADDVIAITWGGDGNIEAVSDSISGKYYEDAGDVQFAKEISESSMGFAWVFREKSGFWGKEMENATANVVLESKSNLGETTNVKMTYVHTYQRISIIDKIEIGSDFNIIIDPTIEEYAWQIQLDIRGLNY